MRTQKHLIALLTLGISLAALTRQGTNQADARPLVIERAAHERLDDAVQKRAAPMLTSWRESAPDIHHTRNQGLLAVAQPDGAIEVGFTYYQAHLDPSASSRGPLVLVYSGLGGFGILEKAIAQHFTKQGISVAVSHYFEEEASYDLLRNNTSAHHALAASFALTDYLTTRPEIDPSKISLIGLSYGGIRGLFHTLLDPRINGTVLMVTGAPLSEVMAYSQLPRMQNIRRRQMQAAGLTSLRAYIERLDELSDFHLDDGLVKRRSPADFHLFIANDDTWVPTFYQWKLWEALGKPSHEAFALGHIRTPIMATVMRSHVMIDFFRSRWSDDANAAKPRVPVIDGSSPPADPW